MRLAHRVLASLAAATSAVFVVNAAVLHSMVNREFQAIETELAVRDAQRAVHAISNNLEQLQASVNDWALWDSAFAFMAGGEDRTFIAENLVFQSFKGIRANLMVFVRPGGSVAWGDVYDLETEERIGLAPDVVETLLTQACGGDRACASPPSSTGIVPTREGSFLLAASPILRSDGSGPPAGTLVFGRLLHGALVAELADQAQAPIQLRPAQAGREIGQEVVHTAALSHTPFRAEPLEDAIEASTTVLDMLGAPALALEVRHDRAIRAAGQSLANYGLALTAAMLLAAGLLALWLLRYYVVRPVHILLDKVVRARGADGALDRPGGADELKTLSAEFDRTLQQLQETRRHLVEQSFYTGMAELVGGMTHNLRNTMTPILVRLWRLQDHFSGKGPGSRMGAALDLLPAMPAGSREEKAVAYLRACVDDADARTAAAQDDVSAIADQIAHMEQILADHQRFTHSGRMTEAIDAARVVETAVKQLAAGGRGAVRVRISEAVRGLPPLLGHDVILAQVVGNILINAEEAILATGRGRGVIDVDGAVVRVDGTEMAELRFTDDGRGIEAGQIDRIFERGFSTKRTKTGGIGLHWCANSLAGMGGSIAAESTGKDRGATFTVRLQLQGGSHIGIPAAGERPA